jgi:hypothetical protein
MTAAAEPRSELVLLEPRTRVQLETERTELLTEIEKELPAEIASPQEYAAIADLELRLSRFIERTEPEFDDLCSAAHKAWRKACDIRALFIDTPKKVKARLRALLGAYKEAEDRRRHAEERRIALEEHQKETARLLAEAKLLEKQGEKQMAKAIRSTPVAAPVVVLPSQLPEVGLSYREEWGWEPVAGNTPRGRAIALSMLVKPEFVEFTALNDAGLTAFAHRTKGTVRVPGIKFFSKPVAVRRR